MWTMEWDTGAMVFVPKCGRCGNSVPTWFEDAGIDECGDCGRFDIDELTYETTPWPAVEPVAVAVSAGGWGSGVILDDEPPF